MRTPISPISVLVEFTVYIAILRWSWPIEIVSMPLIIGIVTANTAVHILIVIIVPIAIKLLLIRGSLYPLCLLLVGVDVVLHVWVIFYAACLLLGSVVDWCFCV